MDTCFRCGSPVDENDRFCRACGAVLAAGPSDSGGDAPDVFVLKPGTARLELETEPDAPQEKEARPVPADAGPADSTDASPAGTSENNASAAQTPPASRQPMSRREKRIAKKLAKCDSETDGEDYVYPDAPKKSHWKAKLISLLVLVLLIAAVVGGLSLRQDMERAAFIPITTAYEGFSSRTTATLEQAFYPELYSAMTDLGYLSAGGYWQERLDDWESVYGSGFITEPQLRKMTVLRGTEKQEALKRLQTEYGVAPRVGVLARMEYTVTVIAPDVDATVRKSALVGRIGGSWYLLQEDF